MSSSKRRRRAEHPEVRRAGGRQLARMLLVGLTLLSRSAIPPARAEALYTIDEHVAAIEFTVSHLGLFTSHGRFGKFKARLTIDPDHPERTGIAVDVDASSVSMAWDDAEEKLRSPAYFDARDYPEVEFRSTGVALVSPDHYAISGVLKLRGVTQPLLLDAQLVDRHLGVQGSQVADFRAEGQLKRSAFGMTADQTFISDVVDLTITVRLQLESPAHAG